VITHKFRRQLDCRLCPQSNCGPDGGDLWVINSQTRACVPCPRISVVRSAIRHPPPSFILRVLRGHLPQIRLGFVGFGGPLVDGGAGLALHLPHYQWEIYQEPKGFHRANITVHALRTGESVL